MMRVLIHNQKGGVGKTTTTANLGAALARAGAGRVVLADLDPQMHLTAALGFVPGSLGWDVADWLAGRPGAPLPVENAPGLFLIPGHAAPVPVPEAVSLTEPKAEWLLMDAAPTWSDDMARLMQGSDMVISPVEPDFLGLNGVSRLLQHMQALGMPRNRLRLLICRYSSRLAIHREVRARLASSFGQEGLLPVAIRNSVRLAEAPGQGRTIFNHAPESTGAIDYALLADVLTGHDRHSRKEPA